ncbi:PEP-CTERM sorting domain-containing protein [Rubellicoccus peritrichatus]|uniref:PEP-CTERM sorting domain-containing protein n=1 Tax=Rubellicoccus peritrichatus TaxID=3080537 RepID=A0AAQ3LGJ3_9BACT|nr:PEP-CTERM sorting domain-containing protein [Puniceicoccus sp. CR14]WOO43408.1 PEP-CTERM sorting domain-containing protein [Puniceicoccus sp. CR14]
MKKSLQLIIAAATISVFPLAASAQTLAGSFLMQTGSGTGLDSTIETSRTTGGNVDTRGAVAGDVGLLAGTVMGSGGYTGLNFANFSFTSNYTNMNRFGGAGGAFITWDFDFSTYLAGKTIGTGAGESSFAVDVNYAGRREGAGGNDGVFYISFNNGSGLTLDTTLVTDMTPGDGATAVMNASNYTSIGTIPGGTGSGSASYDITSFLADSTDGRVRVAYFDDSFSAAISVQNASGIVETINIPEPATVSGFFAVGALVFAAIYRSRRRA